ncbi:hypothetical protein TNCV_3598411 [Trichonephila clavipes]|nr:hypothetical protein TNCV_3598411 [Trichonephila clavipes]
MVRDDIGYTSRSPLVCIEDHQDSAGPDVAGIVRTILNTENARLLPWFVCSPDLSPIENVWSKVAERVVCYHTLVTKVDER